MDEFQDKMREKIRRYSDDKYLDEFIHNEFLTDDMDADIFLKLDNKNQLFDSRTVNRQRDIRKEVFDYIEDKSSMLENDMKIHLHVMGVELDAHEKEEVRHIIKEHYAIELYKIQKRYNEVRNKIIFLILFGIISFSCYTVIYFLLRSKFFLEVFCFFFTFSLWEAFDCIMYKLSDIKDTREAITQNLLINVTFEDEKK